VSKSRPMRFGTKWQAGGRAHGGRTSPVDWRAWPATSDAPRHYHPKTTVLWHSGELAPAREPAQPWRPPPQSCFRPQSQRLAPATSTCAASPRLGRRCAPRPLRPPPPPATLDGASTTSVPRYWASLAADSGIAVPRCRRCRGLDCEWRETPTRTPRVSGQPLAPPPLPCRPRPRPSRAARQQETSRICPSQKHCSTP